MKLQLDTQTKIITIEEVVNLAELLKIIDELDIVWEEWSIQGKETLIAVNPIKFEPSPKFTELPWITPYSPTYPTNP